MTNPDNGNRDFTVTGHGSIYLLTPHSQDAEQWIEDKIVGEVSMLGNSVAVEHRYIEAIVDGIYEDGLEVVVE